MIFTNDNDNRILGEKSLKLGADIGVAAGPAGREASFNTNAHMEDRILSYSHSRGLYAGIALDGSTIGPDDKMNEAIYGKKVEASLLLKTKATLAESSLNASSSLITF